MKNGEKDNGRTCTTKQMGDACEMFVAAEMTLAGVPAMKMPDNWPCLHNQHVITRLTCLRTIQRDQGSLRSLTRFSPAGSIAATGTIRHGMVFLLGDFATFVAKATLL